MLPRLSAVPIMPFIAGATTMTEPTAAPAPTPLLAELAKQPGVAISLAIGTEHFREGLITLTVASDGKVRVEQLRSGETRRFDATWTAAEVTAFGKGLVDDGIGDIAVIPGPRNPGDVPLDLSLSKDGASIWHMDVWHGDRYKSPAVDKVLNRLDATVRALTKGELPF